MSFKVTSHRRELMEQMEEARSAALEAIGSYASDYAAGLAPHDTGRLRNSITYVTKMTEGRNHTYQDDIGNTYSDQIGTGVPEDAVYVGTNVEYAIYQELGTSKIDPHPYLKPAVLDHLEEYKLMAKKIMGG